MEKKFYLWTLIFLSAWLIKLSESRSYSNHIKKPHPYRSSNEMRRIRDEEEERKLDEILDEQELKIGILKPQQLKTPHFKNHRNRKNEEENNYKSEEEEEEEEHGYLTSLNNLKNTKNNIKAKNKKHEEVNNYDSEEESKEVHKYSNPSNNKKNEEGKDNKSEEEEKKNKHSIISPNFSKNKKNEEEKNISEEEEEENNNLVSSHSLKNHKNDIITKNEVSNEHKSEEVFSSEEEDEEEHGYLMSSSNESKNHKNNYENEGEAEERALRVAFEKHMGKITKVPHEIYAYKLPTGLWFIVRYKKNELGEIDKYMNVVSSLTGYLDKLDSSTKSVSVNVNGIETVFRLTSKSTSS